MSHSLGRATAAHYVLRHYGEPGRWIPPGDFYRKLIAAAAHADSENIVRISLGFPAIGWAVSTYKTVGPGPLIDATSRRPGDDAA